MDSPNPENVWSELPPGLQEIGEHEFALVLPPKPREATAITGFLLAVIKDALSARQNPKVRSGTFGMIKLIAKMNGATYAVNVAVDALPDTALADTLETFADGDLDEALKALRRARAETNDEGLRTLRSTAATCLSKAYGQYQKAVADRQSGSLDQLRPKAAKIELYQKAMFSALTNSALYWEMGAYTTAADLAEEARASFTNYHTLLTAATVNSVKSAKVELFFVRYLWNGGNPQLDSAKEMKAARIAARAEVRERIRHLEHVRPQELEDEKRKFDLVYCALTTPGP